MADVALRLALRGPEPPDILALSRRGRLPQAQTAFNRAALPGNAVATIRASGGSLRGLVRVVHALSRQVDGVGGDWREVINAVRKIAPELWARLDAGDRRRFCGTFGRYGTSIATGSRRLPRRSCNGCAMPAGSPSEPARSEVVGADGRIVKGLYYIGPWLRARDWEATAVPELREHASRLAERLAGTMVNDRRRGSQSLRRQVATAEQAASR